MVIGAERLMVIEEIFKLKYIRGYYNIVENLNAKKTLSCRKCRQII